MHTHTHNTTQYTKLDLCENVTHTWRHFPSGHSSLFPTPSWPRCEYMVLYHTVPWREGSCPFCQMSIGKASLSKWDRLSETVESPVCSRCLPSFSSHTIGMTGVCLFYVCMFGDLTLWNIPKLGETIFHLEKEKREIANKPLQHFIFSKSWLREVHVLNLKLMSKYFAIYVELRKEWQIWLSRTVVQVPLSLPVCVCVVFFHRGSVPRLGTLCCWSERDYMLHRVYR